jgi:type II secretory pathway predicted ATPase ExeA
MYQEHFGLKKDLFEDGIAQDIDVFLGAPQKLVVTNLGVALTLHDSVALLVGPAGVGKTTLAAYTLRAMATRLALGWLGSPPATSHELLEMLLTEFGFSPYKNSRVERLQMWRQFLNEMRATDTRVCVLVESAENFAAEVLAALESLTAADPNGCPGANIVVTCRTPVAALVAEPALASFKQRTRLRWTLEPLTRAELRDYLAHCVTAAGADPTVVHRRRARCAAHVLGRRDRVANNLSQLR